MLSAASATDTEADPTPDTEQALPARLPLNELRVFAEAFDRVSSAYVEEIDDRTLLENAIKGMLSQLDPHSAYLDRDSFSDLQEDTTGNYGGIGLEVSMEDGFIRIISPMDGTPAEKAGVKPGDLIVQLNDQPIKGMSLGDAIDAMRGEPGSTVRLTLIREGTAKPFEVSLTREIIAVASVRQRVLDPGYGYIRIAQFQSNTGTEVEDAVTALTAEGKLLGLVLDLRNNPGGILQSAVAVSDVFIDDGLIVYTAGRLPNSDMRFSASTPDATNGTPIVVLVNEGTASASEIVAGALQDHHRAIIMGVNTFGKGSVQTILPLNNEKAIKLTTALYYTPNGRSIQAEGIVPDIWVDRSTITPEKQNQFSIKEKDLPGHLLNGEHSKTVPAEVYEMDLATSDYQLHEALILLKGINILAAKVQPPQG
ncbi:S41 family peptidase [Pseudomonadales bacterium]|nr:S41 family peptidase [Pseudomonadales bacterium]MDA9298565.1 S41 family peptidase [Pseudomonadales bacterium]MDA9366703.1 S41 family peptidase [Pseudomonadales bacterium]MDB9918287.1 S41 family peptidase [Pseudomonadales bacterium]MDB9942230.1 S41 family peptidase [Pseudomonadales bacterium]